MSAWNDFSDADEQQDMGEVIPKGTIAKVYMKLRPGGYDDPAQGWTGGIARRSESTGSVFLDCEYTVMGGPYNKRKVWSMIGLYSPKGPKWSEMGRAFIRAALESAHGITPDDKSERAMNARRINSLEDLDGLTFAVKIDVKEGENGYDDKNVINNVIPVKHRQYAEVMNGTASAAPPASTPKAPKASASVPEWAR